MGQLEDRVERFRADEADKVRIAMQELLANQRFAENMVHVHKEPAQSAAYAPFPDSIGPAVKKALESRGIESLYTHQAEAISHVLRGRHTVVVTPTASGKTLCYNVPVLTHLERDPTAKALYLFPTKALSRDQTAELNALVDGMAELTGMSFNAYTYDGDTPADQRRLIRNKAQVVVTNPDMLHASLLPHHPRWETFLRNLKVVVVDEVHTYRGLFGSHVANVFRRLRRLCRFYGSNPVFVCASATIANPKELAAQIIGESEEEVALVDKSGAPRGERWFVFYNPPMKSVEQRLRQSAVGAARQIAATMLKGRIPTITFAHSRTSVEILLKALRDTLRHDRELTRRIAGYRGGYLPGMRREIERGLRNGDLLGVVSTNALELGIDIGSLQVCVMAGYPGTIASTWQQAGRAGRSDPTKLAVAFLIASSSAADQFIVQHPEFLLGASPEHGRIDPDNLRIVVEHLKCAVFELPYEKGEAFGDFPAEEVDEILEFLSEEAGIIRPARARYHWAADAYPASSISLRSLVEENFLVVDITESPPIRYGKPKEKQVIAEVDFESAHTSLHKDAIYQLDGKQYIVEHLDYENRKAYVRSSHDEYYTLAMSYDAIKILEVFEQQNGPRELLSGWGDVRVSRRWIGFKKIKFKTQENLGYGEIRLPDLEKHTTSYWLTFPSDVISRWLKEIQERHQIERPFTQAEIVGAMTGLGRLVHTVAAVQLMCDRRDIGHSLGSRDARWWARPSFGGMTLFGDNGKKIPIGDALATGQEAPQLEPGGSGAVLHDPTLFLYDSFPGGVGFADRLYEEQHNLPALAFSLVQRCGCEAGCPACVGPPEDIGLRGKLLAAAFLAFTIQ